MLHKNEEELRSTFHLLHDKVRSEACKLSASGSPRQQYACAVFASIIEHVHGIYSLLNKNPNVATVILRATLEAHIHLILTSKHPEYHERQQRNILEEKLKRLKGNKDYPHFTKLNGYQLDEEISETQKKINQYKEKEIEPYKQWFNRFKDVGDPEKYVLYQRLCDHAHHNIETLYDRHLDGSPQLLELTMFRLPDNMKQEGILAESAKMLVESVKLLAEVLGQSDRLDLKGVEEEYSAFMLTLTK